MSENPSKAMPRRWRKPKQARSLERVNRILNVAEGMFVEQGYAAATTKAIAVQAKVPIGSLYQFFPDKAAILQALTERYNDLLNQRLEAFGRSEVLQLPLADYVNQLTDGVANFFSEYPGYYAIFMEVQRTIPELDEAADAQLIQTFAALLSKLNASLSTEDCEAIAFVLVKAIGNLLWLSFRQEADFRQRLVIETKRLTLYYLQNYLPAVPSEAPVKASLD